MTDVRRTGGRRRGCARARFLPAHLVRRFWWAVTAHPLGPAASAFVSSNLLPAERELFEQMSASDQRHHVQVARRFVNGFSGAAPREWVAGALLHDIGKLTCGLGTFRRVIATLAPAVGRGDGAFARYRRHEAIGASLLLAVGSEATTVALVGHWPDAPVEAACALDRADEV
ncbi:MAG: hypothetical protein F2873_11915 [Actinobacteria bacterium]|uniref:Unannotated protein n=1 Tax=freshwater metagenome TaxID=449393 RepID=A0A6J7Q334_9ZZZZ|nr:hypothetical protein [Actinomycetota bacterium]